MATAANASVFLERFDTDNPDQEALLVNGAPMSMLMDNVVNIALIDNEEVYMPRQSVFNLKKGDMGDPHITATTNDLKHEVKTDPYVAQIWLVGRMIQVTGESKAEYLERRCDAESGDWHCDEAKVAADGTQTTFRDQIRGWGSDYVPTFMRPGFDKPRPQFGIVEGFDTSNIQVSGNAGCFHTKHANNVNQLCMDPSFDARSKSVRKHGVAVSGTRRRSVYWLPNKMDDPLHSACPYGKCIRCRCEQVFLAGEVAAVDHRHDDRPEQADVLPRRRLQLVPVVSQHQHYVQNDLQRNRLDRSVYQPRRGRPGPNILMTRIT